MLSRVLILSLIFVLALSLNDNCYAHGGCGGGGGRGGGGGSFGGGGHWGGGGHCCFHSGSIFHGSSFGLGYSSYYRGNHIYPNQYYWPNLHVFLRPHHHQYYSFNNSYAYISSLNAMSVLWLIPNYSYQYFAPCAIYSDPDYQSPNYLPLDLTIEPINKQVYLNPIKNTDLNSATTSDGMVYSIFLSPAQSLGE